MEPSKISRRPRGGWGEKGATEEVRGDSANGFLGRAHNLAEPRGQVLTIISADHVGAIRRVRPSQTMANDEIQYEYFMKC